MSVAVGWNYEHGKLIAPSHRIDAARNKYTQATFSNAAG